MARGKKSKERERRPTALPAAGLLTFYEEDIGGIRLRPEVVVLSAFLLSLLVVLAHLGLFTPR
uniref:Preprotein translocase subunit Sec61beta n=1 Tax=Thermofilum pendens TaxID=2269 RepID=A0A7C1T2Q2_THEPE